MSNLLPRRVLPAELSAALGGAFARLAVLMIAVVVGLVGAEAGLQMFDWPHGAGFPWSAADDTGFRQAPHVRTRMRRSPKNGGSFETNAHGLRDEPVDRKRGFRILLLDDSTAYASFAADTPEFESRYGLRIPERRMTTFLRDAGIAVESLNPALRAHYDAGPSVSPLYFPIAGHFTDTGHRVVADALAAFFAPRVLASAS